MEARSKLFLVNHDYGAVCCTKDEALPKQTQLTVKSVQHVEYHSKHQHINNTSVDCQSYGVDGEVNVTRDGYYLSRTTHNGLKSVFLNNILLQTKQFSRVEPFALDDFLNPAHLVSVFTRGSETLLCGLSNDGREIYAYTIMAPQEHERNFRIIQTNVHTVNTLGSKLFNLQNDSDIFITSLCNPDKDSLGIVLAVAMSDGSIHFGHIEREEQIPSLHLSHLQTANEEFKNAQLIAAGRFVIAHTSNHNKLRIWDLNSHNNDFKDVPCPAIRSLQASLDGKYIIGVNKTEVHCFELPSFEHHQFKLAEAVDDCVIGTHGDVIVTPSHRNEDRLIQHDIINIGNIKSILEKSHSVIPLNAAQNNAMEKKEKEHHHGGFLGKLLHPHSHHQEDNKKTSPRSPRKH